MQAPYPSSCATTRLGMWWLEKQGAQMNATTYLSRTNYYETMPTDLLQNAIQREAARMANPVFRPEALKRELTVVANEAERGRKSPLGLKPATPKYFNSVSLFFAKPPVTPVAPAQRLPPTMQLELGGAAFI